MSRPYPTATPACVDRGCVKVCRGVSRVSRVSRLDTLTIPHIYSCQCVELLSRLVCRGVEVSCQELCRGVEAGALKTNCGARNTLRYVPQDMTQPACTAPAATDSPTLIGLASLSRTPRSWWPSPRLDGRLEVCPSQRHGLGTLIRPGAETRSSRPCSGPALLPDSASPASRRDVLGTTGRGVR